VEQKKKNWVVTLLFCISLAILPIMWLGFGKNGVLGLYRMERERQTSLERVQQITRDNQVLKDEIQRLTSDGRYMEAVVRNELGLVGEKDLVYRFKGKIRENGNRSAVPDLPARLEHEGSKNDSGEGRHDDPIK
jgi:cell division protein FtsB